MTENLFDLTGHVALVTGGNAGIGLGMATALARAGADVCVWGTNDRRSAEAVATLARYGGRALAVTCDVGEPGDVDRAMAATLDALGRVDSCFANAGVGTNGVPFLDMTLEEFRRVTRVNLDGAFLTFRAAARHMVERGGGGVLVGTSSLAAREGQPRGQHYAASKGGLISMIKACAVELARHGIRANAILPGWVESSMTDGVLGSEAFRRRVLTRVPARRWGTPADFGAAAVYLASPASAYQTGDCLVIDGGYGIF
ncbi:SDR family NAD(P)-dependent oxidoreductase [Planotetraspora sp. GP83]|uniref:SDR family NAD(P)-dependent oxidoreductase n=1 Tax=Planotetraspora sp. GP83 TaxID=3156264 RepID=UPI003517C9E3